MATTRKNSLLGLPGELRVRIYRDLFSNNCVRVRTYGNWDRATQRFKYGSEPLVSGQTAIDNGISLVCHLLRTESMRILRETLKLYCEIGEHLEEGGRLCVKAEYRKLIREARFIFQSEDLDTPWQDLPSLETALFECSTDWVLLTPELPKFRTFNEWARSRDVEKYVELVKTQLLTASMGPPVYQILKNEDRGFKIRWKDRVAFVSDQGLDKAFVCIPSICPTPIKLTRYSGSRSTGTRWRCLKAHQTSCTTTRRD